MAAHTRKPRRNGLKGWIRKWWRRIAVLAPVTAIAVWLVTVVPPVKEWLSAPDLALQSVDVFTIEVAPEVYQLGLVARIANLGSSPNLLSDVSFEGASIDIAGRGGQAYIREIHNPVAEASISDSVLLKSSESEPVKLLLPVRIHMAMSSSIPPQFVLWGRWVFRVKKGPFSRELSRDLPRYFGSAESVLTLDQWNSSPASALGNSLRRQLFPRNFPRGVPPKFFLLFSPDPSATFDVYGFDQTNAVRSRSGVMVFVGGPCEPPLPHGWTVLGSTYPAVWADANRLAIYNAVYPPDATGNPRPFGAFSGMEREMGVTMSVPTTTGRDIVGFRLLSSSEYDSSDPVYFRFGTGGVVTRERGK
jgi:hypothetical protein